MGEVIFRYRCRELDLEDINFIRGLISEYSTRGRSHISLALCQAWQWVQANGRPKERAARDLLLRLEEKGFIKLPARIRQKNNRKQKSFDQIPLFVQKQMAGSVGQYAKASIQFVNSQDSYLWDYLIHHYHYLGLPTLVGEHIKQLAVIDGQVVACLAWASAAWKVKARDQFIGWNESSKRKNLHLVANNTRFLIPSWIKVKYLASQILSLSIKQLSADWEKSYGHPVYLAETFVDTARFKGTCYRAANWVEVGQTKGSAKSGNRYRYHGRPKAIYLYPIDRHFRRYLLDDQR